MAEPLPPVPKPLAQQRWAQDDGRLTPEAHRQLLALTERLNAVEARLAALEP